MAGEGTLAQWRQLTSLFAAPYLGSLSRSLLLCLRKDDRFCVTLRPRLRAFSHALEFGDEECD